MISFQKHALLGDINGQPLCGAYKAAWRACGNDKEMMVRLALKQQSQPYFGHACYEKMGLTKEYIMENFAEYINGNKIFNDVEGVEGYNYELYVGFEGILSVTVDVLCMMWCNCTNVEFERFKSPVLYVSNKSKINLTLNGYNSPIIYLFDESVVNVYDMDETCKVTIYKFSDKAKVEKGKYCMGEVKVFNKKLRL